VQAAEDRAEYLQDVKSGWMPRKQADTPAADTPSGKRKRCPDGSRKDEDSGACEKFAEGDDAPSVTVDEKGTRWTRHKTPSNPPPEVYDSIIRKMNKFAKEWDKEEEMDRQKKGGDGPGWVPDDRDDWGEGLAAAYADIVEAQESFRDEYGSGAGDTRLEFETADGETWAGWGGVEGDLEDETQNDAGRQLPRSLREGSDPIANALNSIKDPTSENWGEKDFRNLETLQGIHGDRETDAGGREWHERAIAWSADEESRAQTIESLKDAGISVKEPAAEKPSGKRKRCPDGEHKDEDGQCRPVT